MNGCWLKPSSTRLTRGGAAPVRSGLAGNEDPVPGEQGVGRRLGAARGEGLDLESRSRHPGRKVGAVEADMVQLSEVTVALSVAAGEGDRRVVIGLGPAVRLRHGQQGGAAANQAAEQLAQRAPIVR